MQARLVEVALVVEARGARVRVEGAGGVSNKLLQQEHEDERQRGEERGELQTRGGKREEGRYGEERRPEKNKEQI